MEERKEWKNQCSRMVCIGVFPWKTAAIIFLVAALLFTPLSIVAKSFDNQLATVLGGSFWRLANRDKNAGIFPADGVLAATLAQQAQTEGAVLLLNENGALPLPTGAQLSCFADTQQLQKALADRGFQTGGEKGGYAVAVLSGDGDQALLQDLSQRKSAGTVEKIIVVLQTSTNRNLLQYGVDAALWVGSADADAVAAILAGAAPAGSLSQTWCYDHSQYPAGREGIYIGYQYWETRYGDYVMGTGNAGEFVYKDHVSYPFGFGLGYSSFAYSDMETVYDPQEDRFAVNVTVTNTGDIAARKTVQVYGQAPYTDYDKQHGVEKSAVKLMGFAKTTSLAPESSERVTVYVDRREFASYDAKGAGTYILDAGDHYLTVAAHAHDAINQILAAKGFTPDNTGGRMDAAADGALVYGWTQDVQDTQTYATGKNGVAITNHSANTDAPTVSRQDWVGTFGAESETVDAADFRQPYEPWEHATVSMPTLGADNGVKLSDVAGLSFDDPKWQTLLDQLTFDEMVTMVADAHAFIMPVGSAQAPGARRETMELPVDEELLAATFDTELLYAIGKAVGNTALADGKTVLQGFGGTFEDSFLTGKLRAAQVRGMQEQGVNAVMEAVPARWQNAQSAREGYLRAFQYAVEDWQTTGIAVSGETGDLLSRILRQEWGGKGMVIGQSVSAAGDILAGLTVIDGAKRNDRKALNVYENDPVIVTALRNACHYNLYTLANSAAMNGIGENTTVKAQALPVVTVCRVLAVVSWVLFDAAAVLWYLRDKEKKRKELVCVQMEV